MIKGYTREDLGWVLDELGLLQNRCLYDYGPLPEEFKNDCGYLYAPTCLYDYYSRAWWVVFHLWGVL